MKLGVIFRNFNGYSTDEISFIEDIGYSALEKAVIKFYKEAPDLDMQRVYSEKTNQNCTSVVIRTGVNAEKGPKTIRPVLAYMDVALYTPLMENDCLHDGYCFLIDAKFIKDLEGKFTFAKNLAEVLKKFDEAQKIQNDITKILDSHGLK